MFAAGDTFFFAGVPSHLWVVITDPVGPSKKFLAVNMTTIRDGEPIDPACIIKKGEHDFVKHDTEMYYQKAQDFDLAGADSIEDKKDFFQKSKPVTKSLLARIQAGALKSRMMKLRYQEMVREHIKQKK